MAGLLARIFGGTSDADPDPNPGLTIPAPPRGPAGQTGNPGTTSWTRENPAAATEKRPFGPDRPVGTPPWGRNVPRPRYLTIGQQQANLIPAPAENGSLPFQGDNSKTNPDRVRDTEHRPRIIISQDTPGDENQRNTVYYGGRKAIPGNPHAYRSAPRPDAPTTVSQIPSRYVFGGINGGTDVLDDLLEARRMPYTGHGPGSGLEYLPGYLKHARGSIRGAVLSGKRFFQVPDTGVDQGGAYGKSTRGTSVRRHRPVNFNEPAPMNSQFYDTTANVGTVDQPGTHTQVQEQIVVTPQAARRGWRR
jgi:hypothetical protein